MLSAAATTLARTLYHAPQTIAPALLAVLSTSTMRPAAPSLRRDSSTATPPFPLQVVSPATVKPWWSVTPEERLEIPRQRHGEAPIFQSLHPSQRFAHVLTELRTRYPEDMWLKIESLFPDRHAHRPATVNISIGAEGRAGVELARRGFQVVGVEGDPSLLARTFHFAEALGVPMQLITARAEGSLLHDASADLVTFMHGLHLVDTPRALAEAHRLVRPRGKLVAAWNDRDLSSPFVSDLEGVFERYNPAYCRDRKQRGIENWGKRLQEGGLFKLVDYSVHSNPLHLRNTVALLDILDCMSFVRCAVRGDARKAFNADVRALCAAHHDKRAFELPLQTKLYVLEKVGGEARPSKLHHDAKGLFGG